MLWLEKYRDLIYQKWKPYWASINSPDVVEYSWDYLFTGGKQIRPTLFCELWNYLSPDTEINAELAFAIECIHVASMVIDDLPIMDNASTRRNKTTLHIQYNKEKAIEIAYNLMKMSVHIWKITCPKNIEEDVWSKLYRNKIERLFLGQVYDIESNLNLIELASLKTGTLFEFIAETVALCIGLDSSYWKYWGCDLGILFQWMDDWDDREEDATNEIINAFNADYNTTLTIYSYLWDSLIKRVSKQWLSYPFGKWMEKYFTSKVPIHDINELNIKTYNENINFENYFFKLDNLNFKILSKKMFLIEQWNKYNHVF
jgi:geranylgeranyl pyrophosphate synthase